MELKTLVNFSVYAFIISVAYRLIFMTDNIVVGFVLGPVAIAFYSVGMQLPGILRDSLGNITMIYAPLAYQMDALEQRDSLRRLFLTGSRIALLYVLPGVLGVVFVGPHFLGLWMGGTSSGARGRCSSRWPSKARSTPWRSPAPRCFTAPTGTK